MKLDIKFSADQYSIAWIICCMLLKWHVTIHHTITRFYKCFWLPSFTHIAYHLQSRSSMIVKKVYFLREKNQPKRRRRMLHLILLQGVAVITSFSLGPFTLSLMWLHVNWVLEKVLQCLFADPWQSENSKQNKWYAGRAKAVNSKGNAKYRWENLSLLCTWIGLFYLQILE